MERFGGTLVTDPASGRPCVRTLRLKVVAGPDKGSERTLDVGSMIIGSHPEVDLVLTDGRVSRRHVELALVGDGVRVRDLGSKNGTRVGGAKVETAVVAPGAVLSLGETRIAVEADDRPVSLEGKGRFGQLSTESPRMREVLNLLARVAKTDATLLLEGETGVGKDLVARTLHAESGRKKGPMLVFDCGATNPNLIAGELFGHKKGAFTGAQTDRAGIFEAARGGTVFLDEIGELPLELQPNLLRVLESRQVRRVGENLARDVDVRVVAATHRDLRRMVAEGRFREDLYYRLAIVRVELPPLRARREDIAGLIRRFLDEHGYSVDQVADGELDRLVRHDWPGNVRELRNTVTRGCALGGALLRFGALDESLAHRPSFTPSAPAPVTTSPADLELDDELLGMPLKEARAAMTARFERAYALKLLEQHGGNVTRAAEAAGVARNYLHRLLKKHGIRGRSG